MFLGFFKKQRKIILTTFQSFRLHCKYNTYLFRKKIKFVDIQSAFTFSKLTVETLEQSVKYVQMANGINFEHVSHLILVFLLLTLNM